MRYHRDRRAVSDIVGVLLMLAIVVSLGVLFFGFASGGMGSLSQGYSSAMTGKGNARSEKFGVQAVTFTSLGVDGVSTAQFGTNRPALVQSNYASNCNAINCGGTFSSPVTAGNIVVFGLGWPTQSPPSTPTDSLGDTFQLAVSNSVNTVSWVQSQHNYACGGNPCGQSFGGGTPVTQGDILVFELGWINHAAPATPTDTLGDTFLLGESNSVISGANTYYSYIWYSTAVSTGADTISASFGAAFAAAVWVDEISGYTTTGFTKSLGSSSVASGAASVASFALPGANSVVIGMVEATASTAFTAGGAYNRDGGCGSGGPGCSEYQTGLSAAQTVPWTLAPNTPWVESAIAFGPSGATVDYSYIWYATAANTGSDTITASFGSTTTGTVSMYEIAGYGTLGLSTSTGGSASASTAASVPSFNPPASNSIVIGDAESGSAAYTSGAGYNLISACGSVSGCAESQTGTGSATTVPFTLGSSVQWVETAISFAPASRSLVQSSHAYNCGADPCGNNFGNTVTKGDILVFELGWNDHAAPATPTDTLGDTFTLGPSVSVLSTSPPSVVQKNYAASCTVSPCTLAYTSSPTTGNTLVVAVAAAGSNAPATPSDTQTNTFVLAVSKSGACGANTCYSYIWYATYNGGGGGDTVSSTITSVVSASLSVYEVSGATIASGIGSQTGACASACTTAVAVASFTPSANSIVIGNVETGLSTSKYTAGAGYTTVLAGVGGCDASDAARGCSEYDVGVSSATTAPLTLSSATTWVESAVSFGPSTYYSYIWYTTAASTAGDDTISATFGATVLGSVWVDEISGYTIAGVQMSTGSSAASSGAASVGSFTPITNSIVFGLVEATVNTGFTAGGAYNQDGGCGSGGQGCSEYLTGVSTAQTVPWTLSPNTPWVESAISFGAEMSGTVTLTTTRSNDVVVVAINNEDATNAAVTTVSSVTSPGLAFSLRSSKTAASPTYQDLEVWYSVAASPISSATITVTLLGSTDAASIIAFGVSGANTVTPWDPNVALPATATGNPAAAPSVSGVSTTTANDFILGIQGNGNGVSAAATDETSGSAFSLIKNNDNIGGTNAESAAAEYQVVSARQSGVSVAFGTVTLANDYWTMIADAIQPGATTQGADVFVRNSGAAPTTLVTVYITDLTSNAFVLQTTISTTVNVQTFVDIPHTTLAFPPSHGHTYSFTVTSSLGNSVVYNVGAS
jgi:flagellin-like protein